MAFLTDNCEQQSYSTSSLGYIIDAWPLMPTEKYHFTTDPLAWHSTKWLCHCICYWAQWTGIYAIASTNIGLRRPYHMNDYCRPPTVQLNHMDTVILFRPASAWSTLSYLSIKVCWHKVSWRYITTVTTILITAFSNLPVVFLPSSVPSFHL